MLRTWWRPRRANAPYPRRRTGSPPGIAHRRGAAHPSAHRARDRGVGGDRPRHARRPRPGRAAHLAAPVTTGRGCACRVAARARARCRARTGTDDSRSWRPTRPPAGANGAASCPCFAAARHATTTPDGCEPSMFADQVGLYLDRASAEREALAADAPAIRRPRRRNRTRSSRVGRPSSVAMSFERRRSKRRVAGRRGRRGNVDSRPSLRQSKTSSRRRRSRQRQSRLASFEEVVIAQRRRRRWHRRSKSVARARRSKRSSLRGRRRSSSAPVEAGRRGTGRSGRRCAGRRGRRRTGRRGRRAPSKRSSLRRSKTSPACRRSPSRQPHADRPRRIRSAARRTRARRQLGGGVAVARPRPDAPEPVAAARGCGRDGSRRRRRMRCPCRRMKRSRARAGRRASPSHR